MSGIRVLCVPAIVFALLGFWAIPAVAQLPSDGIQYVSTSGNDLNNGLTWSTAKATIQAAINALPPDGGRVTVGQGDYYLSSGIATDLDNLEIDCVGGRSTAVSSGAVRIHVPSGAVGFTFNPAGSSTNVAGPVIDGCSFLGESGAAGGIHILRTDNFTIKRVNATGFSGNGDYCLYLDGTGDYDQNGFVMNSSFINCYVGIKLNRVSDTRLIANNVNGNTNGSPVAGSIGIYQTSSPSSDTTTLTDNAIQGFDTLLAMYRCDNGMLMGNRFERFTTDAIDLEAPSGYCNGVQIIGGSISNYINGGVGTGIEIGGGVARALVIISNIENVATKISNHGSGTYIVDN